MSDLHETPQYKLGEIGVRLVVDELCARGCFVLRGDEFYGKDNHPPWIEGPDGKKLKIPDLIGFKHGGPQAAYIRWVEVKTKTAFCDGRISGELEHGVDEECVLECRAVQQATGVPVWLFVYEQNTGEILHQRLDALGPGRRSNGVKANGEDMGPMIYWTRSQFKPFERSKGGLQ